MVKEVKAYYVSRFTDGRIFIGLSYSDGTSSTIQAHSPDDAMLMIDILRNERPVYVDPNGTLYTGLEAVGEGEGGATAVPGMAPGPGYGQGY